MKAISSSRQIGQAIREKRVGLSLTQQQLADTAGVSRGFIIRIEKGASTAVYPDKLLAVLSAVGLSMGLFEDDADQDNQTASAQPGRTQQAPLADAVAHGMRFASSPEYAKMAQRAQKAMDDFTSRYRMNPELLSGSSLVKKGGTQRTM